MNKRKLGALLSIVGVATAIAATQFIDLDQTKASYLSLDFVHQALQIKGDYLTADQAEDDYYQSQSKADQSGIKDQEASQEVLPEKMTGGEYSINSQDIESALPEAEAASLAAAEEKQKEEEAEKALKENVKEKEDLFKGKVAVEELNARKEANTDAEIIGKLKEGDSVEGDLQGDWIKIQLDDQPAFVAAKFVEPLEAEKNPVPTSPQKPDQSPAQPVILQQESPLIDQAVLDQAQIAQQEEENRQKAVQEEAIAKAEKEAAEEAAKKAAAEKKAAQAKAAQEAAAKKAQEEAEKKAQEAAAKKAQEEAAKKSKQEATSLMADQTYEDSKVGKPVRGTVCYDGVNVRALPTLNSDIVATLSVDTPIQGKVVGGGWVQFTYNGKKAYISGKMVQVGGNNPAPQTIQPVKENTNNKQNKTYENGNGENSDSSVSPKLPSINSGRMEGHFPSSGQGLVQAARAQLGKPYVLGTIGPSTFDCSGLTMSLYNMVFGMSIPRSVDGQAAAGSPVSRDSLQVGDLVFFDPYRSTNTAPAAGYGNGQENDPQTPQQAYTPRLGHVGIYIGGGRIIHASTPQTGVIESSLSESWYANHYVCARRILH